MEIVERICATCPQESEIGRFEELIGRRLPDDYRAFLKEENGGRPKPVLLFIYCSRWKSRGRLGALFFWPARRADWKSGKVESLLRTPCASCLSADGFGNLLLIGIRGWNAGRIYFWDHELEDDETSTKNVSKVASSFAEFIARLTDLPESA